MRNKFEVGDLFLFGDHVDSLSLAAMVIPGQKALESIWLVRENNNQKSYWTMAVQYAIANKVTRAVEFYGEMSINSNDDHTTVCFRSDLTMRPDRSFVGTVHIITPEALAKVLQQ